uniref:Expansin-like EG45 domain-containing protein n=1 Tax=Tetradesmus obliquus TaxID=3088 RepID=A0A383VKI6_TETOB|eukprot:jgi/Sobl393_1/17265/SZX65194.1
MRAAYAALAAVLLLAVASSPSAAVDCGTELGNVEYISGCSACTAVNVTWGEGRGDNHSGKKASAPLSNKNKDKEHSWGSSGSKLVASCTACNATAFFELKSRPASESSSSKPSMSRCGCMAGYGKKVTGNVTATWGTKTKSIQIFECVKCGDTQVTLSPKNGIAAVFDKAANKWSVVLVSGINSRVKAAKYGLTYPVTADTFKIWGSKGGDGKGWDGKGHDGKGPGKGEGNKGRGKSWGPFTPGQCINCPEGSQKEGTACGERQAVPA